MFGGLTDSLFSAAPSSSLLFLTKMSSSSGGPSEDFLAGFLDVTVLAGGRSFLSRAAASRSALARFAAPVNLVMGVPRLKRGMIRRPSRAHSAQLLVPPILKKREKNQDSWLVTSIGCLQLSVNSRQSNFHCKTQKPGGSEENWEMWSHLLVCFATTICPKSKN